MHNQTKGIIFAVITALLWGVLAVALKIAVRKVDAVTIVWFRFVMAFVPLFVWSMLKKRQNLKILVRPPLMLVVASVALAFNYLGFNLGVQYTSPGNAQLFVQTGQILLALSGMVFFGERFSTIQTGGFLLAIAGLLLFYNQQLFHSAGNAGDYKLGTAITIVAAVLWTVYAVFQKKLVVRYSALALNLFLFGLPAILYLPAVNFTHLQGLNWVWWLLMLFLGMNTLVAYTTLALSLKYLEAGKVSIILIMNPVVTFIIMGVLAGLRVTWIQPENITFLSLTGACAVIAGAILVIRKGRRNQ